MEPEKKPNGAFIGLAVIVIILIIGGIYVWQSNTNNSAEVPVSQSALTSQDSSELNSLEQSANSTDSNAGVDANTVY